MSRRRVPATRLPVIVTEVVYARAALAAQYMDMTLSELTEAALLREVERVEQLRAEDGYAQACRDAADRREITPTRWEYFGIRQQPFVRRAAGVAENQAGRPSSRHDPKAGQRTPGQRGDAGPEPRTAAGAGRRGEYGEDPHVEPSEYRGTARKPNNTLNPQN